MKEWILALALATLPDLCLARPVTVTTGEHDGFTRLAAVLPAGVVWNVEQTDAGYALRAKGGDIRFDVSRAFTRISRGRISNLRVEDQGKTLVMEIGCDCVTESFTANRNTAVIDIQDATSASAGKGPFLSQSDLDLPREWQATALQGKAAKPAEDLPEPLASLMRGSLQADIRSGDLFRAIAQNASAPPGIFAAPHIDGARQNLASNGPLFAHLETIPSGMAGDAPLAPYDTKAGFAACLIALLQTVPEWQVDDKRQGLRNWQNPVQFEGSSTTTDTALLIAKRYLYLGLAEEADLYLDSLPKNSAEKQTLQFLAALVTSPLKNTQRPLDTLPCGGATFGQSDTATGTLDFDAAEIRELHASLLKLPPHLLQFLLPGLKDLFAGNTGEMQTMLAELDHRLPGRISASGGTRIPHPPDPRIGPLSDRELLAYVDRWPDLDAVAMSSLVDSIAASDPERAQALIDNLGVLNTARPLDSTSVATMAELLARYGRVDDAFAMAGTDTAAMSAVWRIVAKAPSDADLLRFTTGADLSTIRLLPVSLRSTVGGRLERLGFDTAAASWAPKSDAGAVLSVSGHGSR